MESKLVSVDRPALSYKLYLSQSVVGSRYLIKLILGRLISERTLHLKEEITNSSRYLTDPLITYTVAERAKWPT